MKKSFILFLGVISFLCQPKHINAGGFQMNLQGQKQCGMGNVGAGTILDASSIFFNPGSVTFLDTVFSFNLNVHFVMPRTVYLEVSPGVYQTEMTHNVSTPATCYFSIKTKAKSKLAFGCGIYTPFGSRAQWDDNWKGQFLIREIDLKTIFIQPTVSWKITDKIGIGAGFIFATGSFMLRKGIPVQDANGKYGEARLLGNASGIGYNAGIFYKATDKLSFGFSYRSQVTMSVKGGNATFTIPASVSANFPQTTFSTKLALPQVFTVGAAYKLNKFLFGLDINYTGWKSYDTLRIIFADHTKNLQDMHSPRMYQNSFTFRGGVQYKVNGGINVRVGAYYDMTPVKSGYLTPETPDTDKIGVTAGASLKFGKRVHLDMSMIYVEGLKRTDTNTETQFTGTYKSRVVIPGIGLEIIF